MDPRVSLVTPKMSQLFDIAYYKKLKEAILWQKLSRFRISKKNKIQLYWASEKTNELNRKYQYNPN